MDEYLSVQCMYCLIYIFVASPKGRDDHMKECSGIGTCNYADATCSCPEDWGSLDGDRGPCGYLTPYASDWDGLLTCPGLVWTDSPTVTVKRKDILYTQRMYLSVNHNTTKYSSYCMCIRVCN